MKKIYQFSVIIMLTTLTVITFTNSASAQLNLNFESGNRAIEQANCWSFGALSYSNLAQRISGNWSGRTNQLTNLAMNACWLKTPWILPGSGEISMLVRLDNTTGTSRGIILSYLPYDPEAGTAHKEGQATSFYELYFPQPFNTNITSVICSIPAEIQNVNLPYKIMFSFVGQGGNGRMFLDDIIIPGTYHANPPVCLPLELISDSDGDGVPDTEDDYPNDYYKAYNNFRPASGFSSIAFEDLWPSFGDSDFNDLVVDFKLNFVTNAAGQLVEMNNLFVIRAIGASQKNGFGFQLKNIAPNAVVSTSGDVLTTNMVSKASNGVETGHNNATFIVIDNAFAKLPGVGSGFTGANTNPEAPWVQPDTIFFNVVFMNQGVYPIGGPVSFYNFLNDPQHFNPFMIINLNRGREVHLPDYPHTSLANPALFGTYDDDTQPALNKYYKSKNNIPWAIMLNDQFDYPIEKSDIINSHLKFKNWAEGNGAIYQDWFQNMPGYRNQQKIY